MTALMFRLRISVYVTRKLETNQADFIIGTSVLLAVCGFVNDNTWVEEFVLRFQDFSNLCNISHYNIVVNVVVFAMALFMFLLKHCTNLVGFLD